MDAFFASVEIARNPSLTGKPVCVGAPVMRRGVVSAASYEARKFGIRAGMPIFKAMELCPHATFVPPDFHLYRETSRKIKNILLSVTPEVEQTSIDEAYLDLRGLEHHFSKPQDIADYIKGEIARQCNGITCSIGVAPSRVCAKVAGNFRKPNGYTEVDDPVHFLQQVEPNDIPGIGRRTWEKLQKLGLYTVLDIQKMALPSLQSFFGKAMGRWLFEMVRGVDSNAIVAEHQKPKSVSHTATLEYNTEDSAVLFPILASMCDDLCEEIQEEGLFAKTIGVIIRYSDFHTTHKQASLTESTQSPRKILPHIYTLFHNLVIPGRAIRLIGMELTNFSEAPQTPNIFSYKQNQKEDRLIVGIQKIRARHGSKSIYFGARSEDRGASSRFSSPFQAPS